MPPYRPIIIDVRMSDYGYWVVTISVAPGKRLSTMIALVGITPEQAGEAALSVLGSLPPAGKKVP